MDLAVLAVLAVAAIAAVTALAPRFGVAAPLILVLLGVGVSLLPFVPTLELDPEWILAGVLPPLLYSASVSMPAMDFRRDFVAISGLSVALVVATAVVLGLLLSWLIPGIGLAVGIALGAILSPTDAVATSIVRRLGVSPRVVTVLEGESLLNDATALVLLRSALAATAASVSLGGVAGDFVRSVIIAVVIGLVVGRLNLVVRAHVADPAVNTSISFIVPFVAFLPAEHLGASGLVAAVAAGLVTGQGAPRYLSAQNRIAEVQNWRTLEVLLEGAVFLVMGLELKSLVIDVRAAHGSLWVAVGVGALAASVVVLIRALYVAPMLGWLSRRSARGLERKAALEGMDVTGPGPWDGRGRGRGRRERSAAEHERAQERAAQRAEQFRTRVRRYVADVDYLAGAPLGWREGTVLVWAGMRGVVTLAAAQTLPADTPHRSLLVLIAFAVAAGTLFVQGGSLPWVVRRLGVGGRDESAEAAERLRLEAELTRAVASFLDGPGLVRSDGSAYSPEIVNVLRRLPSMSADGGDDREGARADRAQFRELRLAAIRAKRDALLRARSEGTYASSTLEEALAILDSEEISIQLREGTEQG